MVDIDRVCGSVGNETGFSWVPTHVLLILIGNTGFRVYLISLIGKNSTKGTGRNGKDTLGLFPKPGSKGERGQRRAETTKGTPGRTVRHGE